MKRRISLLIAVVMAFTLIYTPAAFVYADDENGEAVDPSTQTTAEEPAEDPAADEDAEAAEVPEATEPDAEESEEQVTIVEQPAVNEEGSLGATGDEQGIEVSVTTQTADSITVTWDAVEGAESYKAYTVENEETVEGVVDGTQATISGLTAKTDYTVTVEAYVGENVITGTVDTYTIPSVPAAPANFKSKKSFPTYTISWTKGTDIVGYDYQVYYYKNKKKVYSSKRYGLTADQNKWTYKKMVNGRTYYFQVRTLDKYRDSKIVRSSWETIKVKAATTGFKTDSKGRKYYYKSGTMLKGKEFWIGKLKYYCDGSGIWRGASKAMWKKVNGKSSKTSMLIATSRTRHAVVVYKKIDGKWCAQYEYLCSIGKKGSSTPRGTYKVRGKKLKFGKGHTCWYATRWHPYYNAYFHSVLYKTGSKTKIKDGRLGKNISNGCVRVSLKNAKWIYDNVKVGTKVIIY